MDWQEGFLLLQENPYGRRGAPSGRRTGVQERWQDTPAPIGRLKELYVSMGRAANGTDEEFARQKCDEERSEIFAVAMTRRRQGFTLTVLAGIFRIFR